MEEGEKNKIRIAAFTVWWFDFWETLEYFRTLSVALSHYWTLSVKNSQQELSAFIDLGFGQDLVGHCFIGRIWADKIFKNLILSQLARPQIGRS